MHFKLFKTTNNNYICIYMFLYNIHKKSVNYSIIASHRINRKRNPLKYRRRRKKERKQKKERTTEKKKKRRQAAGLFCNYKKRSDSYCTTV